MPSGKVVTGADFQRKLNSSRRVALFARIPYPHPKHLLSPKEVEMAESPGIESPRMLRLTYEIYVPQGLRRNLQFKRVEQAADRITGAVQGAVTTSFPWADRLKVRTEWSYAWADWP